VAGSYGHGNEPSVSIKRGFAEQIISLVNVILLVFVHRSSSLQTSTFRK
jgi:hypothetical protein